MTAGSGHRPTGVAPRHELSGALAPLVGRDPDLEALVLAVTGPPSVTTIEGEAGIGKTRLVQELQRHPSMTGRVVVVGACRPVAEPFPLGPVLEAVRALGGRLEPPALSAVTGTLRQLLPELGDLLPPSPAPLASEAAERHRLFRAFHAVLSAVDSLTVVLEDVHWADEQTIDLVRYLVGDLPPGLSLVMTVRAEDAGPEVRALSARLPPSQRAHIPLQHLDAAQTRDLAGRLLATDQVTDEFTTFLRERTGGLPFAIEEVTALLRARGVGAEPTRPWTRAALEGLGVPVAVRDHVLQRVSLLTEEARALLEVVSAWHSPVHQELLTAVAGQLPETVVHHLSAAIRSGLLVDDDGVLSFRHSLAAEAVYEGVPAPQRRFLHSRIADVLRSSGSAPTPRLALHLQRSGRLAEWAAVAEEAADLGAAAGLHDEAARLLEPVLRQAPLEDAVRVRLTVKLGRAVRATWRAFHVEDLLTTALELQAPPGVRGELQFLLGALLDAHDADRPRARQLFTDAAANSRHDPVTRARALLALEVRNPAGVSYADRLRVRSEIIDLIPAFRDRDRQLITLGAVAGQQVVQGDHLWRSSLAEIDALCREAEADLHPGQAKALETIAQAACFAGHQRVAERLIVRVRSADYVTRDESRDMFSRASETLIDFCAGRWEAVRGAAPDLLQQLARHQPRTVYKLHLVAGDLALASGNLGHAEHCYAQLAEGAKGGDGADLVPMLTASQIRLAEAHDDTARALQIAEQHLALLQDEMLWPATYRVLPWLAAALAWSGQFERARAIGPSIVERMGGREAPLEFAALRFAEGFARAGGDPTAAATSFLAAADAYDDLGCPVEAAQAREHGASALREGGQIEAAAEPLLRAMESYERLGATRDHSRAAQLARQLGMSVPARHRRGPKGYGDQLTPREREAAELAAAGLTNREIAEQLFVSAETVKKHLQSAMRKLAVRSRAALGRRLPPADPS